MGSYCSIPLTSPPWYATFFLDPGIKWCQVVFGGVEFIHAVPWLALALLVCRSIIERCIAGPLGEWLNVKDKAYSFPPRQPSLEKAYDECPRPGQETIGMGRHHYSSAHWQDVSSSLHKMTQWERRSSLISSPEVYASNQHVATSLLAVVTIWLIMRGRTKQNFSFRSNISNRPFYCCIKTVIGICNPIYFSLLLGFFLISLISSGVIQHSKATSCWHEYNTGHISILPKFIVNLLQVWRNCHMGCLEYYSLLGLAHCSGHLILLLLLCGDVEVNPGPYEEDMGRYRYPAARWEYINYCLRRMTYWETKCSFIVQPESYIFGQNIASSLLFVATLCWIVQRSKKQNCKLPCLSKLSWSSKTADDFYMSNIFSFLLGSLLISVISYEIVKLSKATYILNKYNMGYIGLLSNILSDCHMGCLEYYSLWGLACCSGHLILLLLLCGDVEVNPGPYEEGISTTVCENCFYKYRGSADLDISYLCNSGHRGNKIEVYWRENGGFYETIHVRHPPADLSKRISGFVRICDPNIGRCRGSECTYAHGTNEQRHWNTTLQKQRQDRGRFEERIKDILNIELIRVKLTRVNYKEKFHNLICWEEKEHIEMLKERCKSTCKLFIYSYGYQPTNIWSITNTKQYRFGYIEGLSQDQIAYGTQASEAVFAVSKASNQEIKMTILRENYNHCDDKLFIAFRCTLKLLNIIFSEKVTNEEIQLHNVGIEFEVKHSFFNYLIESVNNIQTAIIGRIIPSYDEFKKISISNTNCNSELHSLERFNISLDDKQMNGLLKIMACDSESPPVLISGAFGTGKTRLLAVAAYCLMKKGAATNTPTRVLICAHHPATLDSLFENYFGPISKDHREEDFEMIRLITKDTVKRPPHNLAHCYKNFKEILNVYEKSKPPFIIVASTFASSLSLKPVFGSKYFTHIFLDEGSQSREPEAISSLTLASPNTKIVIAGDWNQVGPNLLVFGKNAREHGLNLSLLERLYELYIYQSRGYAQDYIVQLNVNYRCHQEIMKIPNILFYDKRIYHNTASVQGQHPDHLNAQAHPDASYPLIFLCTGMRSESCADTEANELLKYLHNVVITKWPDHWGVKNLKEVSIIAASRTQLSKTREVARKWHPHLNDISWKTTYTLQGNEFRAIYVSTVEDLDTQRSSKNPTKSPCDRYVFNTLLTRAKSLVVVAGSPYVLLQTEETMKGGGRSCWKMFIKFCIDNGTFIIPQSVESNVKKQSDFKDNLRTVVNSDRLTSEDSPFQSSTVNVESEPAESPSYVQIQKLTALSASVTWEPLSKSSLKGKLMKYVVSLKESDKSILKSFDATEEKIDFMDLRPFTKYLVQVAACNSAGCGPKSEEIPFTTAEIANENDQSGINAKEVESTELETSTATGHSDTIPPIMASDDSSECKALFQAKNMLATTKMREEYETLLQKVPGSCLSYLDNKVEIGISVIANKLTKWKSKTSLFGISKEEAHEMDSNSGETFLEMWKNKTSCCTYRRLLCICVAGNWSEAANTIVDIVSDKMVILSDVVKGMSSNEEIERNTAHILVVGFPGVGKSSLIHNLLNRSQKPVGSTNVVEGSHVIVDVGTEEPTHSVALVHCEDTKSKYSWKEIQYTDYLVRLLNEIGANHHTDDEVDDSKKLPIMKNIDDDNNGSDASAKPKDTAHLEADDGTTTDTQTLNLEPSLHQGINEVEVSQKNTSEEELSQVQDQPSQIQDQESQAQNQNSSIKDTNLIENTRIAVNITELLHGISFENLKKSSSVYMWDTGGQLEFQEVLSILLSGPSLVIFVLKTNCPMDERPTIDYRKNNRIINSYKTITPNEALLQTLASIDAMQKQCVNSKVPDCQVLIVGTHIDCLKGNEEGKQKEINSINKDLDKLLCDHGFDSLVKYKSTAEQTVMYTVNNESQIDAEFQCLKETITDIMNKVSLFTIRYRLKDLLFCLNLNQTRQKTVLSYDEFVTMAKEFGIHNDDEIENLLNFLHNKVGVIRYYNVKGDKFVICQPHVLFSILTDLIVETFVDSNSYSHTDRRNLMEKGIIAAKKLLEILTNQKEMISMKSKSEFNPNRFLELLKFLRIVVSYKDDNNDEMCFLPTALNHAAEEEDSGKTGETLYIAFACKYCPKGLFIVLIAHLMDQEGLNGSTESITLKLQPHKVSRNKVFFIVKCSNGDIKAQMSVKGNFSHIEVKLYFMDSDNEINKEIMCSGVKDKIMHSIEESLKSSNYNSSRVKAYPGYKCQYCNCFGQINPNTTQTECEPCYKTTPLPSGIKKFFAKEPAKSPSYVQIQKLTAVSASVTWKPLSKSSLNGILIKYVVTRKENDEDCSKSFDATDEKIDFTNLSPFTKFIVQVAACNSAGCGPKSKEITFTTAEAEPAESPSYVQIQKLTGVSATVTWKPLSKSSLNGKLMKYVVTRKENNRSSLKSFDATEENIDFMDLRPFTKYTLQVAACNSAACGPKSEEITFTTDEAAIEHDKLPPSISAVSKDLPIWNVQIRGMKYLNLIRYHDPNTNEKKELRILDDLSADWECIGELLGFRPPEINAIRHPGAAKNPIQCLREVISKWMQNADNMPFSKRYPCNWNGLHNILMDSKHGATANDLKAAITTYSSDLHQGYDAPSKSPRNLRILNITDVSASATWKPLTVSSLNGKFINYEVYLKEKNGNDLKSYETNKDQFEFHNLRPFTEYSVQVAACAYAGCGTMSTDSYFTTLEAVPIEHPNNVQIRNLTAVSVAVTWTPLPKSSLNGKFTKYTVKLKEHDTNNSIFHDTKKIKFKTANLMPFTRYSIEVAACNSEGDGPFCPQVPFTTPQSEPSAAPNVKNFHISDSCKKVRWEALPKSSLNGVLTKYTLVLKKINEEERESFTTEKEKFRLPNLKPFTHYCLQIAASNHAGSGPMSDDFTFCTPEKAPNEPPYNVECVNLSSSSAIIQWNSPPQSAHNGVLNGYTVILKKNEDEIKTKCTAPNEMEHNFSDLRRYTTYSVQVSAKTSKGDGPRSPPTTFSTSLLDWKSVVKIVVGITFVLVLWVEMLLYIILELPICLPIKKD